MMKWSLILFTITVLSVSMECVMADQLRVATARRTVNISSQLIRIVDILNVVNDGDAAVNVIQVAFDSKLHNSFATLRANDANKKRLVITVHKEESSYAVYDITLRTPLNTGDMVVVTIRGVVTEFTEPFPRTVSRDEVQKMRVFFNAYILSPYVIDEQTTRFTTLSGYESFTEFPPSASSGKSITYGSYENITPFSRAPIAIHYESNIPYFVVSSLKRGIIVSHWGNVAVEDRIDAKNEGAALHGEWSRLEFSRKRAQNDASATAAIISIETLLPKSATDVYYRDEIGNVTTSNLRVGKDNVELELRPRYPIFGGWKIHYEIGYNLPSYEFLFYDSTADEYVLRIPFISHLYNNAIVRNAEVSVTLPEMAVDIRTSVPFKLDNEKRDVVSSYGDTVGKPIIVFEKRNLIEAHIQNIEIRYKFSSPMMLREPFIFAGFFFFLFMLVIIYLRLDFTISTTDSEYLRKQVHMKLAPHVARVHDALTLRATSITDLDSTLVRAVNSMSEREIPDGKYKIENALNIFNASIESIAVDVEKTVDKMAAVTIRKLISHDMNTCSALLRNIQATSVYIKNRGDLKSLHETSAVSIRGVAAATKLMHDDLQTL